MTKEVAEQIFKELRKNFGYTDEDITAVEDCILRKVEEDMKEYGFDISIVSVGIERAVSDSSPITIEWRYNNDCYGEHYYPEN